jgi:TetR/AcrR family transcriptional repressor of nem operon
MNRKGELTRELIVEKAAILFNTKGIAVTLITDIMQATKLTKGGILGSFDSKEAINLAAFDYLCANLSTGINLAIQDKASVIDKLFAIIDFYTNHLTKMAGGCPLLNFGVEMNHSGPALRHRVAERINLIQKRISDLIKVGIDDALFRPDTNPKSSPFVTSALSRAVCL